MRPVPHTTSGAGLAVIASLLLELAGASMAAPPPDRRASRPLVFEANRGQADAQVQFVARCSAAVGRRWKYMAITMGMNTTEL